MRNLITDVDGLLVGCAQDDRLLSGVTAVMFEQPATASIAIHGGAPGVRDTALLDPGMSVQQIDALALSGGSAFGLDAMGGVQALLREQGRGFAVREARVPIVPGAILFDLLNGGDKDWGARPPYWDLGYAAARAAGSDFALGSSGAGMGATTADLRGGLGSVSAVTNEGYVVGALVAVNAIGSATIGDGPHFWAAPHERNAEFGGLGWPAHIDPDAAPKLKGAARPAHENTTIAVIATDAQLDKAQAQRIAVMAHDGMARALRPAHAPFDGDIVFAAATARAPRPVDPAALLMIGVTAADCLARAIARAIYCVRGAQPSPALPPTWAEKFGAAQNSGD